MGELKYKIELTTDDIAEVLHPLLKVELQTILDNCGIAITHIKCKYDADGKVSDVLLNYEEGGARKNETRRGQHTDCVRVLVPASISKARLIASSLAQWW